jgi:hypothetical protein
MSKARTIEEPIKQLAAKSTITREELLRIYKQLDPNLKESTFTWRIHALKERKVLRPVKRGIYTLWNKIDFDPSINEELTTINKQIKSQFGNAKYCVWDTAWLNELMIHQPAKYYSIVEIEKDLMESLFYHLKDNGVENVYLTPDEKLLERYVSENIRAIIIKPLISKSPLDIKNLVSIPCLEKILVDLFLDRKIFRAQQGSELINIYNTATKNYTINVTKMLGYAKRRAKEKHVFDFIRNNTDLKEILAS